MSAQAIAAEFADRLTEGLAARRTTKKAPAAPAKKQGSRGGSR
jgi:hypothetical protein